jgi:TonB-dependent starch-binding outer membrane protein SusC
MNQKDYFLKNYWKSKVLNILKGLIFCMIAFSAETLASDYKTESFLLNTNYPENSIDLQRSISGKVTDKEGKAIPGVSILIKGTNQGTISNERGEYVLGNIPDNAILVASFVGMVTREIEINNQTVINIEMEDSTIGLEEVVAIGYGTQKKLTLTGSISSVGSENLVKSPSASVAHTLAGRVTGLATVQYSGMPGADDPRIFIRGIGSLSQSNSSPAYHG